MVVGIAEALTSIKIAFDIAKGMKDLDNRAALNSAVINLQSTILSAQEAALAAKAEKEALIAQIDELEKEVARMKAWDGKAEEYELRQIGAGALAYMRKPDAQPAEPPAWFCVNCFEQKQRSILQKQPRPSDGAYRTYGCPKCHAELSVRHYIFPGREEAAS
jgi:hypothetical protein